jgi:hypothetical protein
MELLAALKKGQPRENMGYILWLCAAQPQYIVPFSLLKMLFSVESIVANYKSVSAGEVADTTKRDIRSMKKMGWFIFPFS